LGHGSWSAIAKQDSAQLVACGNSLFFVLCYWPNLFSKDYNNCPLFYNIDNFNIKEI